ncbi:hypothetical protein AB0J01_41335 [Streptomyces sp. NPDC050204]|uniref:hypothetical protein n=1 Tax=Streptomyces sp. NPDC050204 TaxID=3155514 RepID=UPI003433A340
MTGPCTCRYCAPRTAEAPSEPAVRQAVELPSEPRRFRVHSPDGDTQDCTLHPDGRMTTVMAGQVWVSGLSFDDMLEMNWSAARIEWDPEDEPEPPATEPEPTYVEAPGW